MKPFTTRLPDQVYVEIKHLIDVRLATNMNQFVVDAVQEKLAREREEELRRGFAALAEDFDTDESALWMGAQKISMKQVDA